MNSVDKKKFKQKMAHMSMYQIQALANHSRQNRGANKSMSANETIVKYLPKINQHLANIERLLRNRKSGR